MTTVHTFAAVAAFGMLALTPLAAPAAGCVEGAYRAGCAGPNGAVVVRKPPPPVVVRPAAVVVRPAPAPVTCARGVYRAGCAGPNGAAVVRR